MQITLSLTLDRILKPGGWCQIVEWYQMSQSDNGSITESHALRKWSVNYMQALEDLKDPRAPMQLQTMLTDVGMINVESRMIQIPLCPWSSGKFFGVDNPSPDDSLLGFF